MADTNLPTSNGDDQLPDPAEKIAGNPDAGTRTPADMSGPVPSGAGSNQAAIDADQGGKPTQIPDDPQAAATPGASAPPPPGPAVDASSSNTPEQQARVDAMKAKIEALKAQKAGGAAAAPPAPAPAPAAAPKAPAAAAAAPVASGNTPEQEAKIAEMKAKIEAAKAAKGAGATAPAPAAGAATAVAAAAPAAPTPAPAPKAAPTPREAPAARSAPSGPVKAVKKPLDTESGVWYFGRRNFMHSVGWMSFFGFFTIMVLGSLRSMFPRVIYERPPVFKAGFPGDYVPGSVSEKYKDEERVWIIRQTDGAFIALLAICTHLGCTPRWLQAENKFKCPCHGSGFRGAPAFGVNFEGPAPRPLERVGIHLAPDGQIEIDKSKKFLWEKGQWEEPGATLKA